MNSRNDPHVKQAVHVKGHGNIVIVVGRDLLFRLGRPVVGVAIIVSLFFTARIPSPGIFRLSAWPEGKTALCRDGWYSASHHRPGTCSSHGGVERWRFAANDPFWRR